MTVGIAIVCRDGIIVACDSLSIFSRGVPVARNTNKVHVFEHEALAHPVAMIGAGTSTYMAKFVDRSDKMLSTMLKEEDAAPYDIDEYAGRVCETIAAYMFKEYVLDRNEFYGTDVHGFNFSLIVAGCTSEGRLRAYFVRDTGVSEAIDDCGTIGSGAAYAELFLRQLIPEFARFSTDDAACLAAYTIKGVEIMDPYVGGSTKIKVLSVKDGKLRIKPFAKGKMPRSARKKMEAVLGGMAGDMRSLVGIDSGAQGGNRDG